MKRPVVPAVESPQRVESSSEGDAGEGLERRPQRSPLMKVFQYLLELVRKGLRFVGKMLFNHRYHLDDIITIVRPFIYIYSIIRCGSKSYTPIRISLILDIISILVSFSRFL